MAKIWKIWQYHYGYIFEKSQIMAICAMANFFKILAIMDFQIMAKKNLYPTPKKGKGNCH